MEKQAYFIEIFEKAQKKYVKSTKRLAAEGWDHHWQTLITTIMSAQSRDETTIPIAENLFRKYPTLQSLANAQYSDVLYQLKSLNYNKTKAKHVIEAAQYMLTHFKGDPPDSIDELVKIPGVGRKTANLIITECHNQDGICVDTHVHRIANLFGFVKTKTPHQTELALRELVPKKYWAKVNRIFVLWGKDVPGHDKERFLRKLDEK